MVQDQRDRRDAKDLEAALDALTGETYQLYIEDATDPRFSMQAEAVIICMDIMDIAIRRRWEPKRSLSGEYIRRVLGLPPLFECSKIARWLSPSCPSDPAQGTELVNFVPFRKMVRFAAARCKLRLNKA